MVAWATWGALTWESTPREREGKGEREGEGPPQKAQGGGSQHESFALFWGRILVCSLKVGND